MRYELARFFETTKVGRSLREAGMIMGVILGAIGVFSLIVAGGYGVGTYIGGIALALYVVMVCFLLLWFTCWLLDDWNG